MHLFEANIQVRFGISFNENGMVILRNKRPIANKRNAKKISREVSNIVMEIDKEEENVYEHAYIYVDDDKIIIE